MVLADSAVVILALPAIYREFSATVADVAWVVTAFNLALAGRGDPRSRVGSADECCPALLRRPAVVRCGIARVCAAQRIPLDTLLNAVNVLG